MKKLLVALAVCVICGRVDATDLPGSKDNPFIKRFEGAEIVVYKARNYDQLSFFEKDPAKMVAREGRMEGRRLFTIS
jgi:hypothetical protein